MRLPPTGGNGSRGRGRPRDGSGGRPDRRGRGRPRRLGGGRRGNRRRRVALPRRLGALARRRVEARRRLGSRFARLRRGGVALRRSELLRALVADVDTDDLDRDASVLLGHRQQQSRQILLVGVDTHLRKTPHRQTASGQVIVQDALLRLHLTQPEAGQQRSKALGQGPVLCLLLCSCDYLILRRIGDVQQRSELRCLIVDLAGIHRVRLQPVIEVHDLDVADLHPSKEVRVGDTEQRRHAQLPLHLVQDAHRIRSRERRTDRIRPQSGRGALERALVPAVDRCAVEVGGVANQLDTVDARRLDGEQVDDAVTHGGCHVGSRVGVGTSLRVAASHEADDNCDDENDRANDHSSSPDCTIHAAS